MLEVTASDPGFQADIVSWCRRTGNTVVSNEKRGNEYVAVVMKGLGNVPAAPAETKIVDTPEGKTIIVFSGDLDKVLASFIIANGAAAMKNIYPSFKLCINVAHPLSGSAAAAHFQTWRNP